MCSRRECKEPAETPEEQRRHSKSAERCPVCSGTGRVVNEVGPASFRTWTEECPHCLLWGK